MLKEDIDKELIKRHGLDFHNKISNSKVAICGLGGLGSNIATLLTRAGVGNIHLIDFDKVDLSNIHRQSYYINQIGKYKTQALKETLKTINPYLKITCDNIKLNENNIKELLQSDEIICEAFDDAIFKAMLTNKVLEIFPNKYLIAASGMAGIGDANEIKTKKINEHFYLCGDQISDINNGLGLIAPRVMICAAHQAQKVLQIIFNKQ